jgi:hypothetical protein
VTARWTLDVPTEPQDGRQERGGRRANLPSVLVPLDARLCAWILGLTLAALIVLAFGDALAGWAGVR